VHFGSHRSAQGVIVPRDFGRPLEQAPDELDIDVAVKWVAASDETSLGTHHLDDALRRAAEAAARKPS